MSRQKTELEIITEALDRADWNPETFKLFFGPTRCFKCGSIEIGPRDVLDEDNGLVLACIYCPEINEHN